MLMSRLERVFENAKETNSVYVGVRIRMEGYSTDEIIINERGNFDKKLEYYKNTYDSECKHKFAPGISIVDVVYGDSFSYIEDELFFK